MGAGVIALGVYGFVATVQSDPNFGRILAAYGGVFVAGSLVWGMGIVGFGPDRYDVMGAVICLVGVAALSRGCSPRSPNSRVQDCEHGRGRDRNGGGEEDDGRDSRGEVSTGARLWFDQALDA